LVGLGEENGKCASVGCSVMESRFDVGLLLEEPAGRVHVWRKWSFNTSDVKSSIVEVSHNNVELGSTTPCLRHQPEAHVSKIRVVRIGTQSVIFKQDTY